MATLQTDVPLDDYTLAAFSGTECRGLAEEVDHLSYLNIYGEGGETIHFRLMNHQGKTYDIVQTIALTPETIVGSRKAPLQLTLKSTDLQSPTLTSSRVLSTTYYTLSGIRISAPTPGVYLEKTLYEDGHTQVRKVIMSE